MVMMGQQLMDPERKQEEEDDDYVINANDKVQNFGQVDRSCKQKMNKQEVPTLASLAERVRQQHSEISQPSNQNPPGSPVKKDPQKVVENGDGDGPQHDIPREEIEAETTVTSGGTENPSSGRTSSLGGDSSGIGSSLTTSTSSEPVERDTLSPATESCSAGGQDGDGSSEDVPDNSASPDTDVSVSGSSSTESCKALLLAEDFNGQMTAAKRFLQMVRDGIKDDEENPNLSRCTKSVTSSEASTDDDTKPTVSTNGIFTSSTSGDKVSGGIGSGRSSKSSAGHVPSHILGHNPPPDCVQEVWAHNLLEEFFKIRQVVKKYNFIAMDTEFPGIVVRPQQCLVRTSGVFPYELLKSNVDRLKIIQLGVTFMDKDGKTPEGVCTWQFNFKFSLNKDLYAAESISLLTRCGIQFEKHAEMGIEPEMFGEYFMSSGMVTSDQVTYLTFHSGFDFGYLIKLLSNLPLPEDEEKFFEIMRIYFPNVYDLKFLMKSVDMHGGLQDIANQMGQQRVGTQHQAGSDSLLTGMTFFKLLEDVFNGEIDEVKYSGKLYGFHMTAEDGRDEGWSEIPGDLMDPTSPKPPQSSRNGNNGVVSAPQQHSATVPATSNLNGESNR